MVTAVMPTQQRRGEDLQLALGRDEGLPEQEEAEVDEQPDTR